MNKALNNSPRKNNFFNKFRNPEEFKRTMSPKDIRKSASKILKDIAFGNIDITRDQDYFRNITMLECLKHSAYENWVYNYWTQYGLEFALNSGKIPPDDYKQVSAIYNNHVIGTYGYSIMVEYIDMMLVALRGTEKQPPTPYAISNILFLLVQKVAPYKTGFNNTFITSK